MLQDTSERVVGPSWWPTGLGVLLDRRGETPRTPLHTQTKTPHPICLPAARTTTTTTTTHHHSPPHARRHLAGDRGNYEILVVQVCGAGASCLVFVCAFSVSIVIVSPTYSALQSPFFLSACARVGEREHLAKQRRREWRAGRHRATPSRDSAALSRGSVLSSSCVVLCATGDHIHVRRGVRVRSERNRHAIGAMWGWSNRARGVRRFSRAEPRPGSHPKLDFVPSSTQHSANTAELCASLRQ
jgi:hypothetical protein